MSQVWPQGSLVSLSSSSRLRCCCCFRFTSRSCCAAPPRSCPWHRRCRCFATSAARALAAACYAPISACCLGAVFVRLPGRCCHGGVCFPRRVPGAPGLRLGHLRVGVARSEEVREAELDLGSRTLIAVPLDARVRLVSTRVKREAMRQLGIPIFGVEVSRLSGGRFLLRFDTQERREVAECRGAFAVGHVQFRFRPWRRQGSAATLSRFPFKVRVCIEGVPEHVRSGAAVASLFPRPSFVDDECCDMEKQEEEECFCLWVWTANPEGIPITATLQVEEPVSLPQEGYAEASWIWACPCARCVLIRRKL